MVDVTSSVRMNVGPTALMRIPSAAWSCAAAFVRPTTPCFAATYAEIAGNATCDMTLAMFTIEPPPAARITAISWRMQVKTDVRLTAMTRSHASGG